jgi:hypothetical protein
MQRTWLFAAAFLLVASANSSAVAQTRSWKTVTTGLWNTPALWSPADMPNTAAESATFDLFGTYAVTLDGSSGPVAINHLNIVRGNVTLRPDGVADATISAAGDISLAGQVTLAEIADTHLHLQAQGALSVAAGSQVNLEGGSLSAASTTLGGGTATDATLIQLFDGSTCACGALSIAPAGSVASRAGIDLYDGSSVTTLALSVSAATGSGLGEINVTGSTLTQPASRTAAIGAVSNPAGGLGVLTVSDAGTAQLGSAVVNTTGRVINNGGTLRVAGSSFTVRGGKYLESGAAIRDFAAATNLLIEAGGEMSLVGAALEIPATQTVTVLDGLLKSTGGVSVSGGALALGAGATVIGDVTWGSGSRLVVDIESNAEMTALYVNGVASLGGTIDFAALSPMTLGLEEGTSLLLLTASSIVGEFDAFTAPALASGLAWSFEQTPTSLVATVVAAPLAGDYNSDGLVNAADYTVWRDSLAGGSPVGTYSAWATNYGATNIGATASTAVPEPGFPAVMTAVAWVAARRRRRTGRRGQ